MTPQQAIQVLLQAAALAPLTKRDHIACEEAAQVLEKALAEQKPAEAPAAE